MKIAFITGCLEPGYDGVGDYTTLLARECERLGHEVCLMSLNDPHANARESNGSRLRLSSSLPWAERIGKARSFLTSFGADFASLQFVCYSFHPRGLDIGLASRLRSIIGERPLHIMFHELWIGAGKGTRLKERIFGNLQRFGVLRIIRKANVRVVHSSNASGVALLRSCGIPASVLPLFGSIPLPPPELEEKLQSGNTLTFGLFGTLHPVWQPEPLFSRLQAIGKQIVVAHIGTIGSGEALWNKLTRDYAGIIEFRRHGEQLPERIAEFFRSEIDFGIATTPWALIGKSATVAAMLDHGLPVVVTRDDWQIGDAASVQPSSPLLIKMEADLAEKLSAARRTMPVLRLPAVAAQFLSDIEKTFK